MVRSLVLLGIFGRIFANVRAESVPPDRVMIDTHHIGRTKGGQNSMLHAVYGRAGGSTISLLTDHMGALLSVMSLVMPVRVIADGAIKCDFVHFLLKSPR